LGLGPLADGQLFAAVDLHTATGLHLRRLEGLPSGPCDSLGSMGVECNRESKGERANKSGAVFEINVRPVGFVPGEDVVMLVNQHCQLRIFEGGRPGAGLQAASVTDHLSSSSHV
jgi:hypothetical protein